MTKVLPVSHWKKEEPPERECFSDEDSDEEDSYYEEIMIPKKSRQRENSERTKPQVRSASNQTQNPNCASKEISAAGNTKQPSTKKGGSGLAAIRS